MVLIITLQSFSSKERESSMFSQSTIRIHCILGAFVSLYKGVKNVYRGIKFMQMVETIAHVAELATWYMMYVYLAIYRHITSGTSDQS